MTIDKMEDQILALQKEADVLENGIDSARNITKQIKYSDTYMTILLELKSLGEDLGIDESEFESGERAVFEAKNALESACYEMEEIFQDAFRDAETKVENLEIEVEDAKGMELVS